MSRPSKILDLTPEARARFLGLVRAGNFLAVACRVLRICPDTLRAWRERGAAEPPEEPFASFADDLEQAEAQFAVGAVMAIHASGCGQRIGPDALELYEAEPDWKAFAWMLSKRFPKHWSDAQRASHVAKPVTAVVIERRASAAGGRP